MKLASFRYQNQDRIGAVAPDGDLVDLAVAERGRTGDVAPPWTRDMQALIDAGADGLANARAALAWALAHRETNTRVAMDDVTWHPPIRRPSKICCLALNNSANADRIKSGPKHPAVFVKGANALLGHNGSIVVKEQYGRVHPEPELAVVIGATASNISARDALDHVFGYTIHNDITSPTMRGEDTFHYRAIHPTEDGTNDIKYVDSHVSYPGRYKCSDTFSPLGPWIVTRDEIADPHALTVICRHKGELVTEDNTINLFHKVPDVVAFISEYMTLFPGDVISMGTALKRAGGGGKAVQNVDLYKLGGPVSVTIEGIGTLSNEVEHFVPRAGMADEADGSAAGRA
jgi:2-keto-4-pentenoate hydratase/2-oxohepta-3-ene-1,7-dioic acid hydratase in catechol pathway